MWATEREETSIMVRNVEAETGWGDNKIINNLFYIF